MPSAGRQFFRHVVPSVLRPIRVLWNEIIGFVFLAIALWTIPSTVRTIREFDGDPGSFFRVALTVCFALLMAGFGIGSFLRARRISKG